MPLPTYVHNGKPVWVRFNPDDDLEGLNPAFLTNPELYIPQVEPFTNRIEEWGLVEPEDDSEAAGMPPGYRRIMLNQSMYFMESTPEKQWIKLLAQGRADKLNANPKLAERKKQDLVLKICLEDLKDAHGNKFCWRIVKVPGEMSFAEFTDKVLLPAMGWARGYHAYSYIDRTDGTVYGPKKGAYHDFAHQHMRGHYFLNDTKFTLAHVFVDENVEVGFNYDLGDFWRHHITVDKLVPPSESTGKTSLLSGSGACPPEDGNLPSWQECYNTLLRRPNDPKIQHQVHSSKNYRDLPALQANHKWRYNPHHFDIAEARARVEKASAPARQDWQVQQGGMRRQGREQEQGRRRQRIPLGLADLMLSSLMAAMWETAMELEEEEARYGGTRFCGGHHHCNHGGFHGHSGYGGHGGHGHSHGHGGHGGHGHSHGYGGFHGGHGGFYGGHNDTHADRAAAARAKAKAKAELKAKSEQEAQACQHCGEKQKNLKLCDKCRAVWYCNKKCKQADLKEHDKTCAALAKKTDWMN